MDDVGQRDGALGEALDGLWAAIGDRDSLLPILEADAVLARARAGEAKAALPRLLELTVGDQLGAVRRSDVFVLFAEHEWHDWPVDQRHAVEHFADTWWTFTRTGESPPLPAGTVLACLAHLDLPLVRWLGPWLEDLDGPAARHLAEVVISQLPDEGWADRADEREQILGWARTEPVILGLTLVGGVHLDDGQLGQALDLLL